jgi:transposase
VDEAGGNRALTRLYGRAPRGTRAVGSVPVTYGANLTLIGAWGSSGLEALMTLEGATAGEVFGGDVERLRCPPRRAGASVGRDNRGAQKVAGIREALESCGARVSSLPPYSGALNPIERGWSQRKATLRGIGARTRRALARAITQARATITESDAGAWFAHCG